MMIHHNLKGWSPFMGVVDPAPLEKGRAYLSRACFEIVRETGDLGAVQEVGARFKSYREIVVFGTGGSSLGAQMLCVLQNSEAPQLHFLDNIDPHTFDHCLQTLDLKETAFLVVSKSGTTAETLAQFLCLLRLVREGLVLAKSVIVITEPGDRPLRLLAQKHNMVILDHHPQIGGRFSVFSNVGLLPAALVGIDIAQVRAGGQFVLDSLKKAPSGTSMPEKSALALYSLTKTRSTVVMMPYCDRLITFAKWFAQLWGESLGKGGQGTTPVVAVGTVDQHSQLQLYLDGPKDKVFTILVSDTRHRGPSFPDDLVALDPALAYLKGKTLGDLFVAEQYATADTLQNNQCPIRIVELENINAHTLGVLAMHFMLETIFMAALMGVDPFDQPAVEESKILTRQYMTQFQEVVL